MKLYEKAREPEDQLCKNPCLVSHEAKPERKNLHLFTNCLIMDEEKNQHDRHITSMEHEEDLLAVDEDEKVGGHYYTSAAKAMNMPIDIITQSAGWSKESTFGKYYHKPVEKQANFGNFLLNNKSK